MIIVREHTFFLAKVTVILARKKVCSLRMII